MKRLLTLLLSLSMVLSPVAPIVFAEETYATREMTISAFVEAIGFDGEEIDTEILESYADGEDVSHKYSKAMAYAVAEGLLKGYDDNTLRPGDAVTRTEALVILRRAMADIKFYTVAEQEFTDIPDWAEKEINDLAAYGIVKGYGDGTYGAEDFITREQVDLLVDRLPDRSGPKADYYTHVNGAWMAEEIPGNYPAWSSFDEVGQKIANESAELVYELAMEQAYGTAFEKGSNEQKIADMFKTSRDEMGRNMVGTRPLVRYLSYIDRIKDMDTLLDAMVELEISGFPTLLSMSVSPDLLNAKKYALYLNGCYTGFSAEMIQSGDFAGEVAAYQLYIEKLSNTALAGLTSADVEEVTALNEKLAKAATLAEDVKDISTLYHPYTMEEMKALFPAFDIQKYLEKMHLSTADYVVVMDEGQAKVIGETLTEENLPLIKKYLKAGLLDTASEYLTTWMFDIRQEFTNAVNGTNAQYTAADTAFNMVSRFLGAELTALYLEEHFEDETITRAEAMVEEIVDTYEQRLRSNTWMEEETKNAAIGKLDNMLIQVGYPEGIKDYQDEAYVVDPITEGGSLLDYYAEYYVFGATYDAMKLEYDLEVPRETWGMGALEVNAGYSLQQNSIVIPAGILQAPFFDSEASDAENLGALGDIIAHEISHAFDSSGAQFDKDGSVANWWTEKDKQTFAKICDEVTEYYQGFSVNGMAVNGKRTLDENIADLSAMACIMEIAGEKKYDLGEVFTSYARMWRRKVTPEMEKLLLSNDTHAPNQVRVNAVLSNTPEFAEYYQLNNGDGMFLPAEEQIVIW